MNTPTAPAAKPFWTSKTFWLNTLALVSTLIPAVGEWVKANPVEFAQAMAAANVLLRFITSGKISLGWDPDGSTKVLPLLLLGCTWVGVCGFSLTSCSLIPEGTTGSIYYLDRSSGAKGGLTFKDGAGSGTLFVPVYDADGKETGRARLEVPIRATK